MAKHIIKNPTVSINGVDLSTYVADVTVNMSRNMVDATAGADGGTYELGGLQDNNFAITWRQDFALTKVNATLAPLFTGGTSFITNVKGDGASTGFNGASCFLAEYVPVVGAVGDVANATTTIEVSGAINRV